MSVLSDHRDALTAGLQAAALAPWRVHKYPPETIASPCIWVDLPTVADVDSGRGHVIVANWPIFHVVDGADPGQVAQLDEALAKSWDAVDALTLTTVVGALPTSLDVGGPRTRALVLTADITLRAKTLCPSLLADTA